MAWGLFIISFLRGKFDINNNYAKCYNDDMGTILMIWGFGMKFEILADSIKKQMINLADKKK